MAGAEEVVAAIERARRASSTPGSSLNERGLRPPRGDGPRRGALRLRRDRDVQPAQPERLASRSRSRPRSAIVGRAHADGIRATVTIGVSFGCPFEGAVDPARVLGFAERLAAAGAGRDRLRRHGRRRRAAPGRAARRRRRASSASPVGVHLHNTRNTGFANAYAALEAGATVLDASVGGHRRLPVRAARDREHRHRGSRLPAPRRGHRDGHRPRRADRVAEWLEGVLGRQLRDRSTAPARSRRSPAEKRRSEWRTGSGSTSAAPSPTSSSSSDENGTAAAVPREDAVDAGRPVARACSTASSGSARRPASTSASSRNILHGTTVATNAVLESKGARVGLITTKGFQQILHLARSQTPGPLAGWIIMIKPDPPASLADTREAVERMDAARERRSSPVDEKQVEGDRPRPRRVGRRVADRRADQLVRERRARAGDRRDRRAALPGLPGDALVRGAARVPRVRARADRVHELVRAAEGRRLRRPAPGAAERDRRAGRRQHPPLGRRADDDARGGAQPDLRRALGPVGRRRRRALRRPEGRATTTSSPSTWAGRPPTSRSARTASRRSAARPSIGHFQIKVPSVNVHTVGAGGGSIAHVPGADEGAPRRPAVGRRRARPGRLRQGRRPSRP